MALRRSKLDPKKEVIHQPEEVVESEPTREEVMAEWKDSLPDTNKVYGVGTSTTIGFCAFRNTP